MQKKKPIKKPVASKLQAAKAPAKKASVKTVQKRTKSKADIRRSEVAKKTLAGKKEKEIAKELNMSRTRVAEIKAEPQFPATLAALLAPHQVKYEEGFRAYLHGMVELMGDKKPDSTRFQAMDRFAKLIEIQQPKGSNIFVGVTLEELERRVKEGA